MGNACSDRNAVWNGNQFLRFGSLKPLRQRHQILGRCRSTVSPLVIDHVERIIELAVDIGATDPACDKSPHHGVVIAAIAAGESAPDLPMLFRSPDNSRRIMETSGQPTDFE
jgi:hypothetical protein